LEGKNKGGRGVMIQPIARYNRKGKDTEGKMI